MTFIRSTTIAEIGEPGHPALKRSEQARLMERKSPQTGKTKRAAQKR